MRHTSVFIELTHEECKQQWVNDKYITDALYIGNISELHMPG